MRADRFNSQSVVIASIALAGLNSTRLVAHTIFESAPADSTFCSCGQSASSDFYAAINFQITETVTTGRIGGHIRNYGDGTPVFGALFRIDAEFDRVTLADFNGKRLLGVTRIQPPDVFADASGNLRVTLEPGWYAMVLGAGRFGTTGRADLDFIEPLQFSSRNYSIRASDGSISVGDTARLFVDTDPLPELSILIDETSHDYFSEYTGFGYPAIDKGIVAFQAFTDASGVYKYHMKDGSIDLVATRGTIVPGTDDYFGTFSDPVLDKGAVAFYGGSLLTIGRIDHFGIYTDARGKLEPVMVEGFSIPAGEGGFEFPEHFRGTWIENGAVTFVGANGTPSAGVYVWRTGSVERVVGEGAPIPGEDLLFDSFDETGAPIDGGIVAFGGANSTELVGGIYRATGDTIEFVYGTGTLLPDGITMDRGGLPRMREGKLAFYACDETFTECGLYTDASGELKTVVNRHTLVPGGNGAVFDTWTLGEPFDGRHLAFRGRFGTDWGLFTDLTGTLTRVVGSGDVIEGRVLTSAWLGNSSLEGNKILFSARFEDMSEAIAMARYPAPPGDADDNGMVDLRDAAHIFNCYAGSFEPVDPLTCTSSDFNGDTDVDVVDYTRWITCSNGPDARSPCGY